MGFDSVPRLARRKVEETFIRVHEKFREGKREEINSWVLEKQTWSEGILPLQACPEQAKQGRWEASEEFSRSSE